jgi:SAM-dependent methyltransferase
VKALDLGCGPYAKKEGSVGLDIRPAPPVDVVHDLNVFPYPFDDDEFDWVEMSQVLEHVDRPLAVMNEVHRIAKDGATIRITTPHYTSYYSYGDLEHFHHFGYMSFLGLTATGLFTIERKKLHFADIYKIFGISILANLMPRKWERYLCFLFPALFIEVYMKVVKRDGGKDALIERNIYGSPKAE